MVLERDTRKRASQVKGLVMSNSLPPHGLLCLRNSPGKNTGLGSHSLLQGIFLTWRLNPGLLYGRQILYHLSYQRSPQPTTASGTLERGHSCLSRGLCSRTQPFLGVLRMVLELDTRKRAPKGKTKRSPTLEVHPASTSWMNSWCLPDLPPGQVSETLSPTPHPHPIALAPAGLWDPLPNTAPSPHSSGGYTLALARVHQGCLHLPTAAPSLRVPPPSQNIPGWAFLSPVPRQCSWCCGLGRGWRTRQKARGRELSLSSNGRHGSPATPPPQHNAPPKVPHWCLSK